MTDCRRAAGVAEFEFALAALAPQAAQLLTDP